MRRKIDSLTFNQANFIVKLCKQKNVGLIELDEISQKMFGLTSEYITKKKASELIKHLLDLPNFNRFTNSFDSYNYNFASDERDLRLNLEKFAS